MREPLLSVVQSNVNDPPYPPGTKANGWAPEFHTDRIMASDTWTMAEDEERPWLLRIWLESWRSVPVGSMPADRRLFSRRIGCKVAFLDAHSEILMRGWVLHSDGLLYHDFIVSQVLAMLEKRGRSAEKVAAWRKKRKEQENHNNGESSGKNVTSNIAGCNRNVPVSNLQEQEQEQEVIEANASLSIVASATPDVPAASAKKNRQTCPHEELVDLYHESLPELPSIVWSLWLKSSDAKSLQARWNEDKRHQSLDFWKRFFATVRTNQHWMGQGQSGWKGANLRWLVKKENFIKVAELMVDNARRGESHG